jgi:2-polyprenyl-6-methoxyphenol hydroxylase-like FAD-dependent oxidoreductase
MMLPQAKFLDFLAKEVCRYPCARIIMGATVSHLVTENGRCVGVHYVGSDGQTHEVRAPLTVGADGRFSKVRHLMGIEPEKTDVPMDILWFRLPKKESDPQDQVMAYIADGRFIILLDRGDQWQLAYVFPKGSYSKVKGQGIEAFRQQLATRITWLADRTETFHDWHQGAVLSVESSRVKKWYKPGIILIGDAAHVMSPVGGVGINYAIQDAVETANNIIEPLRQGDVGVDVLARIQRRRIWPTRIVQWFQRQMQQRLVRAALDPRQRFRLPLMMRILLRIPGLRTLPVKFLAKGIFPPKVQP